MKRRLCLTGLCLVLVMGIAFSSHAKMEISFANVLFPNSPEVMAMEKFSALVKERSGGEIIVNVFSGGALGGERDNAEALSVGSLQMAITGGLPIALYAREYDALMMPYIFRDQEHVRKVWAGPIGNELKDVILKRSQIRLIAVQNRGPRNLYSRTKPILTPDDLKGVKLRLPEVPLWRAVWSDALGATTVPVAWHEVYTALQTGVADAVEADFEPFIAQKLYEVQKNVMLTGHIRDVFWWDVSEAWFKSLSKKDQEIILSSAKEAALYGDQLEADRRDGLQKKLIEAGMQIHKVDVGLFANKAAAAVPIVDKNWRKNIYQDIRNTR